jgi:uncharacterized ion transporter superfamily protein YfcC
MEIETMTQGMFVFMVLEAIIFLIPIATLFVKIGKYSEKIEKLEKRIDDMSSIETRLTTIETKIDLLLDNKLVIQEAAIRG